MKTTASKFSCLCKWQLRPFFASGQNLQSSLTGLSPRVLYTCFSSASSVLSPDHHLLHFPISSQVFSYQWGFPWTTNLKEQTPSQHWCFLCFTGLEALQTYTHCIFGLFYLLIGFLALSPAECKLHGQKFHLFCSVLNLQLVEHSAQQALECLYN